jgi:hypothetical protein
MKIIILALLFSIILSKNCPRYQCDVSPQNLICAQSAYDKTADYMKVSINPVCSNMCLASNDIATSYIFNQHKYFEDTTEHMLLACQTLYTKSLSFPGEKCQIVFKECYQGAFKSECQNEICTGVKQGDACTKTEECLAGNFCKNGICTPQIIFGETCENSLQCVNNALCHAGKCTKYGSLATGTKLVPSKEETADSIKILCEFNRVYNGSCVKSAYKDDTKSKFIECEYGKKCSYKYIGTPEAEKVTFDLDCECGYNSKGKAHCPLADSAGISLLI